MSKINCVSILGCGWYGLPLAGALVHQGYQVKGSTTSADKLNTLAQAGIEPYLVNITADNQAYDPDFFDCDVLWISLPPRSRQGEAGAYADKIKSAVQAAIVQGVKQVVFISSTGVYGDVGAHVTEQDVPLPDTDSGRALLAVENYLQQQMEITATIIRFGGLIGPGRNPGGFFAGKAGVPNGQAPVNLIHLSDCIGISTSILQQQAFGHVYNACAPHHPPKAQFYTLAAQKAGLPEPNFIDELQQWKTVSSVQVGPVLGYSYQVGNWDEWLQQSQE